MGCCCAVSCQNSLAGSGIHDASFQITTKSRLTLIWLLAGEHDHVPAGIGELMTKELEAFAPGGKTRLLLNQTKSTRNEVEDLSLKHTLVDVDSK